MNSETNRALSIDVFSDVVCPWCFIGKRQLDQALQRDRAQHPNTAADVHWRPFQLNPQMPREGMARAEYVAQKFGGAARAQEIYARVAAAGKSAGIDFAFEKIARQPSTLDAHRLLELAYDKGSQDALLNALFDAFFLQGADLTNASALAGIAETAGFPRDEALAYLASDQGLTDVRTADQTVREMGVQGVPLFIIDRRYAVAGAQGADEILAAVARAREASAG